jgi:uncharacterized protein YjbI with pentapeptide repeats
VPTWLAALLLAAITAGAAAQPLDPQAARQRLLQTGTISGTTIAGDLDLADLKHPEGGALLLFDVVLTGSLRGAPDSPLEIIESRIGALRLPRTRWRQALTIERTRILGRVGLDGARFEQVLACRRCRIDGTVSALRTRFDAELDFAFSDLAGSVDFSAARFTGVSFDGVRFADPGGALFIEAEFAGPARFAGIDTGQAPLYLTGAGFRDEANFRACRIGRLVGASPPAPPGVAATPLNTQLTVFGGLADFRRCRFDAGVDLTGAAFRSGARFDGVELARGTLDLSGLTQAGEIVLRGLRLGPDASIAVDESGIPGLLADRPVFTPSIWRGLPPDTLDALAARARALGAAMQGRELGYAATIARAEAQGADWQARAARLLRWPTRNGTDPFRPLLLAVLLALAAALLVQPRGVLARVRPEDGKPSPGPLVPVLAALYQPVPPEEILPRGAWCPRTEGGRMAAAIAFGFALVFKLGARDWRCIIAGRLRTVMLFVLWLLGFVLAGLTLATLLEQLPELREIAAIVPG